MLAREHCECRYNVGCAVRVGVKHGNASRRPADVQDLLGLEGAVTVAEQNRDGARCGIGDCYVSVAVAIEISRF